MFFSKFSQDISKHSIYPGTKKRKGDFKSDFRKTKELVQSQ